MRTIQYGIDTQTGLTVSRVDSEIAWPILDYNAMQPSNNFATSYYLEKMPVFSVARDPANVKWTRKLPASVKNKHRKFWGLPNLSH